MTKYTDAAVLTVKRCQGEVVPDIRGEWQKALKELSAYDEGCPKCAFIGLCEDGFVKDIRKGSYGLRKGTKNKNYAIEAAKLILSGHEPDVKAIWQHVTGKDIKHHDQVSIVIALHENGLLRHPD